MAKRGRLSSWMVPTVTKEEDPATNFINDNNPKIMFFNDDLQWEKQGFTTLDTDVIINLF